MSGYFDLKPNSPSRQSRLPELALVMPPPDYPTDVSTSTSPYDLSTPSSTVRPRSSHQFSPSLPVPATHNSDSKRIERPPSFAMPTYNWWRVKRILSRPLVWVLAFFLLVVWYSSGSVGDLQSQEVQTRLKELFPPQITRELHFFPASHNRIHYVGRWTTAPNRLRIDGAFPGVYFDLNVTNTTSVVLSLSNSKDPLKPTILPGHQISPLQVPHGGQYSFSAASRLRVSAPPISLLALVDQEEYVILPNSTGLVAVQMKNLDSSRPHTIRVIAPMTDNNNLGVVQMDGLWLDKGGLLLPVEGSTADTIHDEMDDFDAESASVGKKHRLGLGRLLKGYNAHDTALKKHGFDPDEGDEGEIKRRKKVVEIVTDDPAHAAAHVMNPDRGQADRLLAGVMGWEYLLGEMFSVDHVCVGVEGMCLMQDCVHGTGSPSGIGDVFFRSGPVDSPHFNHPWPFSAYVPDVLIFNLGSSDYHSIMNYADSYNKTGGELYKYFEDTYVSLIKAIRAIAYPTHPATIEMLRLGVDGYAADNAPASIPIFIMRPFGGELEHASQGAVNRLRAEGDRAVYWLDTSGWLDFEGTETTTPDVFRDDSDPPKFHLSERGNQKVAIFLHMHVCRYLAGVDENCSFLPPEVYQGSVFDPSVATFERYIENEKERQMKEIFWETEVDSS